MRTLWVMLGALVVSILIMDLGMVYVTYDKLASVTENALDSALIAGINEEDATRGLIYINEDLAREAARQTFRDNLKLDANLENDIMKKGTLQISIFNENRPYVQGEASTTVETMSPKLFGLEGIELNVKKTNFFLADYK